jgi:hypothetical protein
MPWTAPPLGYAHSTDNWSPTNGRLGNHEHEMVDDERHDTLRKAGIASAFVF